MRKKKARRVALGLGKGSQMAAKNGKWRGNGPAWLIRSGAGEFAKKMNSQMVSVERTDSCWATRPEEEALRQNYRCLDLN